MTDPKLPLPTTFNDTQQLFDILTSDASSLPQKQHLKDVQMEKGTDNEHLGLVARARLTYHTESIDNDQQQKLPKTVVVKMSPASPARQGHASMLHLLEREVNFYTQLKPRIPEIQPKQEYQPSIPFCYYASLSPDQTQQLIVLEDMRPSQCGSIADSPSVSEARLAIQELAKLHGIFFKDRSLSSSKEWLFPTNGELYQGLFVSRFSSSLETFENRWKHLLTDDFKEFLQRFSKNINGFMDRLGPRYTGDSDDGADGRPCLFHGDFKTENIFFPDSSGQGRVAMVDFQTITQGSPLAAACDVAYFIFGCLSPEISTEEFVEELIELYYSQLKQVVADEERMGAYSLEQCRKNVFQALRWPIMMMVFGGAQFRDTTAVQAKRFSAFIERLQRAAYLFYDKLES
eukprot:gb/GECH01012025.1/.p1 GENE.gb/GECH01012025.1/~~gb/GECH01012025.1/.p1  ORF type:complete len:403 (+),score=103.97 gb/GECH01012025.1/:1-1209(+)